MLLFSTNCEMRPSAATTKFIFMSENTDTAKGIRLVFGLLVHFIAKYHCTDMVEKSELPSRANDVPGHSTSCS